MGTDIHGGFIKKGGVSSRGETLENIAIETSWGLDRDYTLFAILADVRNGYGFAGTYRHEPLQAIAPSRGIPSWLRTEEDTYCEELTNNWYGSEYSDLDEAKYGTDLGDHSFTYMTLSEIINWGGWDNYLSQGGVVSKEHYEKTISKGNNPECWCGGVAGTEVHVVDESTYKTLTEFCNYEGKQTTHINCRWKSDETLREMYQWFLDEITRIGDEYGYEDVYLVVGFDS